MELPIEKYADKIVEKVPRKIVGGLAAMVIVGLTAEKLDISNPYGIAGVILCQTAIGIMAIWTHYRLELSNPTIGEK